MNSERIFELRKSRTLKLFYTGGDFAINFSGELLFTTCASLVKVLNTKDGSERYSIGDAEDECRVSSFVLTDDDREIVIAYTNDIIKRYLLAENGATLLHQFRGTHTAPIQILQLHRQDGNVILATGSADFTVKVWNLTARQCTHNFRGGKSVVTALCFVNAGKKLVAGFADGLIHMFHLDDEHSEQKFLRLNAHTSRITSLIALSSDGGQSTTVGLVAFSCDGTASILSAKTLERVNSFSLGEIVESAVLLGGADLEVLTVGEQGVIRVWSLKSVRKIRENVISRSALDGVRYCPQTRTVVAASVELDLFFVDSKTWRLSKQFSGFNDEIYDSCFISTRTNCLALASNAADLRIYSMSSYCCHLVEGHTESVLSVDSPAWDDFLFATGSKDNSIGVWRISPTFEPEALHRKAEDRPFIERIGVGTGHTNSVTCVRFSHAKINNFLVSVSADSTLKIWSMKGLKDLGEATKLTPVQTFVAHSKDINSVDVSANDRLCVTASMDKTAKLWHIDPKTLVLGIAGTLSGHKRGVWSAKFSPTQQIVATCSGDCTIKLFSLVDKECLHTLDGHSFAVLSLRFVPNDHRLLSADGGGILKVWDVDAGVCEKTIEAHTDKIWSIGALPPTPSLDSEDEKAETLKLSRYVTVGSDSEAIVWEDVSELVKTERIKAEAKRLVETQSLQNFMDQEKFIDALILSLDLDRPYQCLTVIQKMLEKADGGESELAAALKQMSPTQISCLLSYTSQWNTNSKHSFVSHSLLNQILRRIPLADFMKVPNVEALVKSLMPYSTRHYERLYDLRTNVSHLDYVFGRMRIDG